MSIQKDQIHYGGDNEFEDYQCGHCGRHISGKLIANYKDRYTGAIYSSFLLCPSCNRGTVTFDSNSFPSVPPGESLEGMPPEINDAYEEARRCFAINAYTACDLICRKILMHIAVEKGAKEGETFEFYIDHIEKQGYITPAMKPWVDVIRKNGNEATHKLSKPNPEKTENTFNFTMQLLRIVYEMEHKAKKFTTK